MTCRAFRYATYRKIRSCSAAPNIISPFAKPRFTADVGVMYAGKIAGSFPIITSRTQIDGIAETFLVAPCRLTVSCASRPARICSPHSAPF